jgi:hypothetical protein
MMQFSENIPLEINGWTGSQKTDAQSEVAFYVYIPKQFCNERVNSLGIWAHLVLSLISLL